MSEIPTPEQTPTPDSLHDAAVAGWNANPDAIRDDELSYGGQSLLLYPSESPRDTILILRVSGAETMDQGRFRMLRRKGSRVTESLDMLTTKDGTRLVSTLVGSDLPGAVDLVPTEEGAIPRMQKAIAEASTTRPVGRIAKILGRTATHK